MDEPTDMPEGTVLELVADDEGDDLDEAERAALHDAIERAMDTARAGKVRAAADVLAELRHRSRDGVVSRNSPRAVDRAMSASSAFPPSSPSAPEDISSNSSASCRR